MTNSTFVYVTYIATTPEKLREALTSGDFTKKYWFGMKSNLIGKMAQTLPS
jgi:uncharacterized protein YndB with AHSA1/START domain